MLFEEDSMSVKRAPRCTFIVFISIYVNGSSKLARNRNNSQKAAFIYKQDSVFCVSVRVQFGTTVH